MKTQKVLKITALSCVAVFALGVLIFGFVTGFGIEDYTALFPFETTCILSDPLANADALVALILHRMAQARDGENFGEPQRRIIPCRFAQGDSVGRV